MFDSKKKNVVQGGIEKPAQEELAALKSVKVHTIPPEFYGGGLGDGAVRAPEKAAPQKEMPKKPSVNVPPKPEPVPPKKLELEAKASAQLTHGGGHKGLIIGGILFVVVLALAGGFAYWWFVIRVPAEPEPSPVPIVTPTPTAPSEPTPELEPVPEPTPEPTPTAPEYPIGLREYQLSVDSDLDSLTDIEEEQIYGSDPLRPDDDSDGFVDGHEVFHLYNPAARAPVALIDSGLVTMYENATFGYELYVPRVWSRDLVDADGQDVLFTSATGEYIEVLVHPNLDALQLGEWFAQRAPAVSADQVRSVVSKQGLVGLLSPDSLSWFVARDNLVYELRYDIGTRIDANFMRTFVMMQNSFAFTTEPLYVPEEIEPPTEQSATPSPSSLQLFGDNEGVEPQISEDVEGEEEVESDDVSLGSNESDASTTQPINP